MHKPPLAPGVRNGPQQGLPPGRVTLAAAELQTQMGAAAAAQQGWPGQQHGALSHLLDPQAQLVAIQAEMSRLDGQNKNLTSTLQQKERELSALRQKAAAAAQPGAAAQAQRSAYAVGEMQRQLESFRQQLQFKEQEVGAGDARRGCGGRVLAALWGACKGTSRTCRCCCCCCLSPSPPTAPTHSPLDRWMISSATWRRRLSGSSRQRALSPSCGSSCGSKQRLRRQGSSPPPQRQRPHLAAVARSGGSRATHHHRVEQRLRPRLLKLLLHLLHRHQQVLHQQVLHQQQPLPCWILPCLRRLAACARRGG